MNRHRFFIWTGGGPGGPEDGQRAEAIPLLPVPDPLPRAALITYWWGKARFEFVATACTVRTTPWGAGQMTWLHCKGAQPAAIKPDAPTGEMVFLIPAQYVTGVKPGPTYQITDRHPTDDIGLFPPSHPAPPHALPLPEIERALAGLSEWPTATGWRFSITYPVFVLQRESGDYVGSDAAPGVRTEGGSGLGIPVFTTEARALEFLLYTEAEDRVVSFDRVAAFRRFLRSLRDEGTLVLFDPVPGGDGVLYADHAYPAAVVLERFLPQIVWGLSYPVYVLRRGGGFASIGGFHGGTFVELLPVFTDSDLADRAAAAARKPTAAEPIPDAAAFARLVRALPPSARGVAFDPPTGGVANVVIFREELLAKLEDMEL
jgi:hypothetical protein